MKKCIGCENIIYKGKKKPYVFKKQKYCSRRCGLIHRNNVSNPMKNKSILEKISGKNSNLWLGESAGYFTKHQWIRRSGINRDKCLHCGILGEYRKDKKWTIEFCNISGEYKRDVNDWICLCRKCHRKFDIGKLKYSYVKCVECNSDIETKFPGYVSYCNQCNLEKSRIRNKLRKRLIRGYKGNKYVKNKK